MNEFQQMKVAIECIQNEMAPFSDKKTAMEQLVDLVENIDNACGRSVFSSAWHCLPTDLQKITDSYHSLRALLHKRSPVRVTPLPSDTPASTPTGPPPVFTPPETEEMRALAAQVFSAAVQNNPDLQQQVRCLFFGCGYQQIFSCHSFPKTEFWPS